ncbi:MAG TPA: NADH-quinone oxidoreductase subunit A [Opitutaceae bacterium]|nr:NADH-quinone oxidoreductase subunit A [Opitutaceae bacterium]
MELAEFGPVLVQIGIAVTIAVGIIAVSHIFGQRARGSKIKDSAYECGVPTDGAVQTRFSVKFYLTAMLFILFDIEVVFLLPWTVIYREFLSIGVPVLLPGLFFISLLVVGLVYELRKGALDWEK